MSSPTSTVQVNFSFRTRELLGNDLLTAGEAGDTRDLLACKIISLFAS